MTASVSFLSFLITGSTVVATFAPVVLIVLWIRDARRGTLW